MSEQNWACEAYGPEMPGPRHCFHELAERCATPAECVTRMAGARQHLYQRIQELAAAGDPVWVDLAEHFPDPSTLLGGQDDDLDPDVESP